MNQGFYGVGVVHGKNQVNIGTLWRTASLLGAAFVFTVGKRYRHQSSDTRKSWKYIPLMNYLDMDDLKRHLPHDCLLVGVEMDPSAVPLRDFTHPERAVYLLGAEDHGLTKKTIDSCHRLVVLPGEHSMNVAVAGSIVIYDRVARQ